MERIQHGLDKYKNTELIITGRYTSGIDCRVKDARPHPFPTQPGDSSHMLCLPQIHSDGFGGVVNLPNLPLNTETTIQDKSLLIPPLITANYSPGYTKSAFEALPTVTASDSNGILTNKALQSFLAYYYGSGNQVSGMANAIQTMTTRDRAGLVIPEIKIEDCYYRTIKAHEIQRAMAFADSYIVLGNSKQKVRQLGNAVTPPVAEWISKRCIQSIS